MPPQRNNDSDAASKGGRGASRAASPGGIRKRACNLPFHYVAFCSGNKEKISEEKRVVCATKGKRGKGGKGGGRLETSDGRKEKRDSGEVLKMHQSNAIDVAAGTEKARQTSLRWIIKKGNLRFVAKQ